MRIVQLGLLALLITTSCTKFGKNMTVKGKVINPVTGAPVEGAVVSLQKGTVGLPGGYKTVREVTTAADGSFEISKFGLKEHSVVCFKDGWYDIGWHKNGIPADGMFRMTAKKGKTTELDYYTVPYGGILMHIENVNCSGPTDSMQYTRRYQFDPPGMNWSIYFKGCYAFTSTELTYLPSGNYYFTLRIIRNGQTTYEYDTVYVSEAGSTMINLEY